MLDRELIAYLAFLGNDYMEPGLEIRTIVLLAAVICLPGINYLGMLIQNGTALLFPAWAHLGRCHRVIGKYIDGQHPRDIFFFEMDGAYVIRLTASGRPSVGCPAPPSAIG